MTKSQDTSRKSQENGFERMGTDKNGALPTSPEGAAATKPRNSKTAEPGKLNSWFPID